MREYRKNSGCNKGGAKDLLKKRCEEKTFCALEEVELNYET